MKEAQAWRIIGEAFEAKAAHPELTDLPNDLASDGLCHAINNVGADPYVRSTMKDKSWEAVDDPANQPAVFYIKPFSNQPGGAELRATLAYLLAEEAKA
jgi:hypothetical protein